MRRYAPTRLRGRGGMGGRGRIVRFASRVWRAQRSEWTSAAYRSEWVHGLADSLASRTCWTSRTRGLADSPASWSRWSCGPLEFFTLALLLVLMRAGQQQGGRIATRYARLLHAYSFLTPHPPPQRHQIPPPRGRSPVPLPAH